MSQIEKKENIYVLETLNILQRLKNEIATEIGVGGIKKGKRKRLKTTARLIEKMNTKIKKCISNTGDCDGLVMTIAKGDPKSRKVKCGEILMSEIVSSKQPVYPLGSLKSRYKITYYHTHDDNLFIEYTQHHTKIQAPRSIKLVGINELNRKISNK